MARKSTKKNDSELKLEQVLWNCRVALRGVGSMEKNRDAVISLVFLKFAGDKFNNRRKELVEQYGDIRRSLRSLLSTTRSTYSICPNLHGGPTLSITQATTRLPPSSTMP